MSASQPPFSRRPTIPKATVPAHAPDRITPHWMRHTNSYAALRKYKIATQQRAQEARITSWEGRPLWTVRTTDKLMPRSSSEDTSSGFKALEEVTAAIEEAGDKTADTAAQTATGAVKETIRASKTLGDDLKSAFPDGSQAAERAGGAIGAQKSSFVSECLQLAQEGFELQRSAFARLFECRSPDQLLKLQLELAREAFTEVSEASQRLSRASYQDFSQLSSQLAGVAR